MSKLYEFMDLLYGQINKGIYVWGGDGENLSEMKDPIAWIDRKVAESSNRKLATNLYKERAAKGIEVRAFDCSGLVYWCLKTLGLQKEDVSSRGLYNLCDKVKSHKDLKVGDFVFHHDGTRIVHVGVYAGDGQCIEDRGYKYGVVLSNRSLSAYWNRYGRWKDFKNDSVDPEPPKKTTVYVKGRSVNVRNADNTKGTIIGIAHRKDTYPLLAVAPSGWYMINYNGAIGYISNRADLTELR